VQYTKIQDSKYVTRYRELYTLGIPEYLSKRSHKDTQEIIARFRCENEKLCNRFCCVNRRQIRVDCVRVKLKL